MGSHPRGATGSALASSRNNGATRWVWITRYEIMGSSLTLNGAAHHHRDTGELRKHFVRYAEFLNSSQCILCAEVSAHTPPAIPVLAINGVIR